MGVTLLIPNTRVAYLEETKHTEEEKERNLMRLLATASYSVPTPRRRLIGKP